MLAGSAASRLRKSWNLAVVVLSEQGRADDVEFFESEFFFQRPQGVNLAGNADDGELAVAGGAGGFQQGEQRGVAHAHTPACGHAGRVGDQHGHWRPLVVRRGGHGQHRVHGAGLQQNFAHAGCDACPLRAG